MFSYFTSSAKKMKREALVQSKLRHPNIVLLMAMVFEENSYGIVLEYMKYGDLREFLENFDTPWSFKLQIALDIAVGMSYLHSLEPTVIHGDLKIQNILIGDGFRAKVKFILQKIVKFSECLLAALHCLEL